MPGSKKTAYEKAQLESEGKARLSLSDLAGELMKANARSDEKPKPQNTPEENIRQSAQTYGQITQQLNDFYKPTKEQESRKLEEKVDELLAKLKTQEQLQDERSRQEQMMERSYQMAAKYLNPGTAAEQSVVVAPPQPEKRWSPCRVWTGRTRHRACLSRWATPRCWHRFPRGAIMVLIRP